MVIFSIQFGVLYTFQDTVELWDTIKSETLEVVKDCVRSWSSLVLVETL